MKFLYHPDQKQITLAGVLYALGDPVRLEIVRLLATKGEQCCADFDFAIAKSTMSNHFKILRESGVVLTRKEGTQHINTLRQEDLETLFPGLVDAVLKSAKPMVLPSATQN
ncbi:metalloregulator ArsR/SmtB family transcription factor [Aetokthonos hydrillicola Thurmond2011]|jgi:DNA-binding transcriptional ArsR family regulator|uniref:Metalloregulator ArsR/SmtB family transcription factor n=1 Tax=Aetokthonos hydrillicola Thurmond2011 TaxID=2712845 RepID=A0AAP5MAR7_9CYAN|nr:metalloregulator ArsR/SmtB family transcription factor [Aetokthonos hydrillicola]MBO3462461.1 helix-turn-helix transcriptional regulator [Aetokthonos hydrillicola CCALA 1050]MBW4589845.1 metalloregulator ArsR/SmtB family transcription factor [Aetokthonos hydrillicola CCALA 1050]MDR9898415.1 metalloregulator ArsR/SmtB family transcription factor [Aetokthonos hydrillicola Thurmond2011]